MDAIFGRTLNCCNSELCVWKQPASPGIEKSHGVHLKSRKNKVEARLGGYSLHLHVLCLQTSIWMSMLSACYLKKRIAPFCLHSKIKAIVLTICHHLLNEYYYLPFKDIFGKCPKKQNFPFSPLSLHCACISVGNSVFFFFQASCTIACFVF